jgi:hypothetical protein
MLVEIALGWLLSLEPEGATTARNYCGNCEAEFFPTVVLGVFSDVVHFE